MTSGAKATKSAATINIGGNTACRARARSTGPSLPDAAPGAREARGCHSDRLLRATPPRDQKLRELLFADPVVATEGHSRLDGRSPQRKRRRLNPLIKIVAGGAIEHKGLLLVERLLARGRSLVVDVEQTAIMRRALPPPGRDAGGGRANTGEVYYRPRHPGFDRGLKLREQPRTGERSRLGSARRVLREIKQRRDVEFIGAINIAADNLESCTTLPGMQRNTAMAFATQRDAVALVGRAIFVVIVGQHQFGRRCRI
jgi:hypothetical protein